MDLLGNKDPEGKVSASRNCLYLAWVVSAGIGFYAIYKDKEILDITVLVGTYLAAGYTGKINSKTKETEVQKAKVAKGAG